MHPYPASSLQWRLFCGDSQSLMKTVPTPQASPSPWCVLLAACLELVRDLAGQSL